MSKEKPIYSKWIKRGKNTFIPTDNSQILPVIDPGVYDLRVSPDIGFYMVKKTLCLDEILEFPSSIQNEVVKSIKDFWRKEEKFKEYSFAFKRGILLHGKPGSGKTCIINLCMKYVIEELKGVIIPLNNIPDLEVYSTHISEIFRIIEPSRPIIVVIEDIEGFCNYTEAETLLLNILDGINQLNNVVYLATTNYIEKLKERIINRPSRFDRRIYVPFLSLEDRIFYFQHKLTKADQKIYNIKKWANDTDGMSIAHLAELIKSVVIFESDYEETIKLLKEMNNTSNLHSSKYEKTGGNLGFRSIRLNKPIQSEPEDRMFLDEGIGEEINFDGE